MTLTALLLFGMVLFCLKISSVTAADELADFKAEHFALEGADARSWMPSAALDPEDGASRSFHELPGADGESSGGGFDIHVPADVDHSAANPELSDARQLDVLQA